MKDDISDILGSWPYEGDQTVRIIEAADGRRLLQVRLPVGIEQYEMDGRPDGQSAGGEETFLDFLERKLAAEGPGSFSIGQDDFILLQNESILYYYRYIMLFQLGDYTRTVRDTGHNLRACELVERFAKGVKDRNSLLQYKPYIIRVHSVSRAMLRMEEKAFDEAAVILNEAVHEITDMEDVDTVVFKIEKVRSLGQIKSFLSQVTSKETDPLESLQIELKRAVEEENYEHAAEIRDRIREKSGNTDGTDL